MTIFTAMIEPMKEISFNHDDFHQYYLEWNFQMHASFDKLYSCSFKSLKKRGSNHHKIVIAKLI